MNARDEYDIRPLWAADRLGELIDMHHAMCDEIDRLRVECATWMNGVADAVEPLGYDRGAACGPADLLPGLDTLTKLRLAVIDQIIDDLARKPRLPGHPRNCGCIHCRPSSGVGAMDPQYEQRDVDADLAKLRRAFP